VGHIVIGKPSPKPLWKRFGKNTRIVENLIQNARGVTVAILDTSEEALPVSLPRSRAAKVVPPSAETPSIIRQPELGAMLSPSRIVIWDNMVQKETVLWKLAEVAASGDGIPHSEALFSDIMKREEQGSTFFNEGVAFPHIRVRGLVSPLVALGITKEGVLGTATEKPIELVFLILSPEELPEIQIQILSLISRAAQNRHLFLSLTSARKPEDVIEAIHVWEMPGQ
jgi:mannitol/fructose-specific phosphotransferase system IIA component (Ntr-type)